MKDLESEVIDRKIYLIRGHRVMLDHDLAKLYEVPPKRLNEQVKRNLSRFPCDFMFQLTIQEHDALRSQIATLESRRGAHRKYLPYAFTEHGIAMLSSVLKSERAVQVNIELIRAFIRIREWMNEDRTLAKRLTKPEEKYDVQFKVIFDAIRKLLKPELPSTRRKIGIKW